MLRDVHEHGRYIMGPELKELEEKLAWFTGTNHCIAFSSGTQSLEFALRAQEIGPGDEVITVPFSWISSAVVIMMVGATPVFVDIDAGTYNLDPIKMEEASNERTKAVIPVSLLGHAANLKDE